MPQAVAMVMPWHRQHLSMSAFLYDDGADDGAANGSIAEGRRKQSFIGNDSSCNTSERYHEAAATTAVAEGSVTTWVNYPTAFSPSHHSSNNLSR